MLKKLFSFVESLSSTKNQKESEPMTESTVDTADTKVWYQDAHVHKTMPPEILAMHAIVPAQSITAFDITDLNNTYIKVLGDLK